jgi:hypothetical protein
MIRITARLQIASDAAPRQINENVRLYTDSLSQPVIDIPVKAIIRG